MGGFPLPASAPGGAMPPLLQDWQFSFAGLTFGAGTSFGVLTVKGLAQATIRHGDVALPRDSGEIAGLDVYSGRDPQFDLWMTGTGGLQSNQVELGAALALGLASELPLWIQLPTLPLLAVMARPRKRDMDWDANFAAQAAGKPSLSFHCTDPRLYTAGSSVTLNLGTVGSGGLTFPVGPFPVTFGGTTPSQTTVTNGGNCESRPIVVFNGPLTNPWMGNVSLPTNPYVQVIDPYQVGYTIAAGDQVLVDLNTPHRMLYYVGGIAAGLAPSSVRSWLTAESSWWNLPKGPSTIQFGSQDSASTSGSAQLLYASAYQL